MITLANYPGFSRNYLFAYLHTFIDSAFYLHKRLQYLWHTVLQL